MEIRDYLRTIGRRFWLLVLVPLVTGGAAFALLSQEPAKFQSAATVTTDPSVASRDVERFIANFRAAVKTKAIIGNVATDTGVRPRQLRSGLAVRQLENSSILEVQFTTTREHRRRAENVVRTTVRKTLGFLEAGRVDLVDQRVADAEAAYAEASGELDAFTAETGLALPQSDYQSRQNEISQLRVRMEDAAANGSTEVAARLRAVIEVRQAELVALAPNVTKFQQLQARADAALTALNDAEREQAAVSATADQGAGRQVTMSGVVEVDRASDLVRRTAAVAAAGLVIAIALVVVLDSTSRRPRRERASARSPIDRKPLSASA